MLRAPTYQHLQLPSLNRLCTVALARLCQVSSAEPRKGRRHMANGGPFAAAKSTLQQAHCPNTKLIDCADDSIIIVLRVLPLSCCNAPKPSLPSSPPSSKGIGYSVLPFRLDPPLPLFPHPKARDTLGIHLPPLFPRIVIPWHLHYLHLFPTQRLSLVAVGNLPPNHPSRSVEPGVTDLTMRPGPM